MALTAKLVNPTPFKVDIPYEKGISLKIEPDSSIDVNMNVMDDFRPGKPGSENVRSIMEFHGVFLMDSDLSYDVQAAKAIENAVRSKTERFKTFVERTRNSRLANQASVDDETMNELINSSGYGNMQNQIDILEKRLKTYREVIGKDSAAGKVQETLDPERTCFVLQPPREFPSKLALEMFLDENPDIRAKHDQLAQGMSNDE